MTPIVLEDASLPVGTSPAVVALLSESDRSRKSGDLDSAVVVMERALRIDARNPTLTYKLAQLRLKQSKPQQAEELARKAALLAGNDQDLKRKSWLLIANARQMQQDISGAKEAKAKAQSFYGH
jgi:predicted Zn-dependent protease